MPQSATQNFALVFRQYCTGVGFTGNFCRVIRADSYQTANTVAEAMLGEEVASDERLYEILYVGPTDQPPMLGSLSPTTTLGHLRRRLTKKTPGQHVNIEDKVPHDPVFTASVP